MPKSFKLWNTGQKVLHSLFPWVGTGKNMLQIETLDYRFGLFLNSSAKINKAQNEEIDAIRPDNVHSQNMTDALNTLKKLQKAQFEDYMPMSSSGDWLTWLLY